MLKEYLDNIFPLNEEKWENISKIKVENNILKLFAEDKLVIF